MEALDRDLVFIVLQFLDEEKFEDTLHSLEKESGFFFNMKYFEDSVTNAEWDEVEKYLAGFTKVDDNPYSTKIFFEIRKQKYLEALDKRDFGKALEVLTKDLKVFSTINGDLYNEIALLMTLGNFRENEQLSKYGDIKTARAIMLNELKMLIKENPLIRDKIYFPTLKNSRLRTLINQQSLNWQHHNCKNPMSNPEIKTLFVDHACGKTNSARAPSPVTNQLLGSMPPSLGAHGQFQTPPAPLKTSLGGWMANPSSMSQQAIFGGVLGLGAPNNADFEHVLKRPRPFEIPEEINDLPTNVLPVTCPGLSHAQAIYSSDHLPKILLMNLNQGSAVKSMDFHPVQQTLLLVGTIIGDVAIWEIVSRDRLVFRNFKVWDLTACSMALQASFANEYTASVNRVTWSPDGSLFGVAYSKHIVHIYSYHGGEDLRNHLEIDAHVGSVSDLAFSYQNKQPCIITCGEDKSIKVWDAVSGSKQYTFEGHEALVYSVCPHFKENIEFIFSTAIDGKIKAWMYDNMGSRVDYDAPGHFCTTMAYSTDGSRLFLGGTSKNGESYIVEWNESEGTIKRTYNGLGKRSVGVVQFDTTKSRFLAAGDEFVIKFWDMNYDNLLFSTDADGGLPVSPCIRFNKGGVLLAVSTSENGVKILGNGEAIQLVRSIENCALDRVTSGNVVKGPMIGTCGAPSSSAGTSIGVANRTAPLPATIVTDGESRYFPHVKPIIKDELEKSKISKLVEIHDPSQLRSLRISDNLMAVRIMRLIYTNSGGSLLALACTYTAQHKLWKWQRNERNMTGKASTNVQPQFWQPSSGRLMTNKISGTNLKDVVPCLAISKNNSCLISASGGDISLFDMMTFKTMRTFMPPPPAATNLAFNPEDNNIIAIGMDDSSIQIYNVRVDKVQSKLEGHHKRVTGLAFSTALNALVSSGADAQLCVWSTDGWEKQATTFLKIPAGRTPDALAETRVQFHQDQKHVLVVHETQIAIYEAPKLECIRQYVPPESTIITDATYSCDSHSIYAGFEDGSLSVFTASTLELRCRITPRAYFPSKPEVILYPVVIAAHPSEPNQFALGLSDGGVQVFEPLESDGKWGHTFDINEEET